MVDLDAFASDGYVKVERAAPREVADSAQAVLWQQLSLSVDEPEPVKWADAHRGRTPRFMAQSLVARTTPLTPASTWRSACVWED